jgi:predicted nucleic acid-binding Zn ribbon protein
MPKCANYVCLNDVKVGFKPETYCRSCVQSNQPYVYQCDVCKVLFTPHGRNAKLQQSCSDKCKIIKRSVRNKMNYMKLHPPKEKECPTCGNNFSENRKYCSYECNGSLHRNKKYERLYKNRISGLLVYMK